MSHRIYHLVETGTVVGHYNREIPCVALYGNGKGGIGDVFRETVPDAVLDDGL